MRRLVALSALAFAGVSTPAAAEQLCPADQHSVTAHHRRAYIRTDGTHVTATDVKAHCHPNPLGYSKWKDRLVDTKATDWRQNGEEQKKWTIEERERVLEALADLPDALQPDSVTRIYRFDKSEGTDINPASGQAGEIGLYDEAFAEHGNLTRVLAHELAHEVFRQDSFSARKKYADENGWRFVDEGNGQRVPVPSRSGFVEEDGSLSVTEDFANNIEYFLFNRKQLQRVTPNADHWISRRFGDTFKLRKGSE